MKITKQQLKQIIREALLAEAGESGPAIAPAIHKDATSTSDARRAGIDTAKQQGASGITPEERGLIKNLSTALTAAATKGNIRSGKTMNLIKLLHAELTQGIK